MLDCIRSFHLVLMHAGIYTVPVSSRVELTIVENKFDHHRDTGAAWCGA